MINHRNELYGRQINCSDIDDQLLLDEDLKIRSSIQVNTATIRCLRCDRLTDKQIAALPNDHFYCPQCINLGRMSTLQSLCSLPEPNHFPINNNPLTWNGQLTSLQQGCADRIIMNFKHRQHHLLWAVTGAGKTEMLFPGLEWAIQHRFRIGIASPRVDVCIELFPRIKAAFDNTSISLLHGKVETPYQYTQITICTTHQLLRFYRAFDILIIDEVDSFPYVQDPGLHFAVTQAIKENGRLLYLTATPGKQLFQQVKKKQLSISYLPLRFHRHLLPTIRLHCNINWQQKIRRHRIPNQLVKLIKLKLKQQIRFLLFIPQISYLPIIDQFLKQKINADWQTVYSADPERLSKVQQMRNGQLDFLITTTILERGVTFFGIDVIVLGADDAVFSTAALVQIAGRVGRSAQRPTGHVDFFIQSNNQRIHQAQKQIQHMNRLGRRLLNEKSVLAMSKTN